MAICIGADEGVVVPAAVVAATVTSYTAPGVSPGIGQFFMVGQVTVIGAPPPTGVAVKV